MTRLELLTLVVGRARAHGFEFRRWYTQKLGLPWISAEASLALLDTQRRYYALIFSHEFAVAFWKPGGEITFTVPAQSFSRAMPDGSTRIVQRKPFLRRTVRPNAWRYHLRQMALAEEPLRYLRKFLPLQEDEILTAEPAGAAANAKSQASTAQPKPLRVFNSANAVSTELPAFLRRPYLGSKDLGATDSSLAKGGRLD